MGLDDCAYVHTDHPFNPAIQSQRESYSILFHGLTNYAYAVIQKFWYDYSNIFKEGY